MGASASWAPSRVTAAPLFPLQPYSQGVTVMSPYAQACSQASTTAPDSLFGTRTCDDKAPMYVPSSVSDHYMSVPIHAVRRPSSAPPTPPANRFLSPMADSDGVIHHGDTPVPIERFGAVDTSVDAGVHVVRVSHPKSEDLPCIEEEGSEDESTSPITTDKILRRVEWDTWNRMEELVDTNLEEIETLNDRQKLLRILLGSLSTVFQQIAAVVGPNPALNAASEAMTTTMWALMDSKPTESTLPSGLTPSTPAAGVKRPAESEPTPRDSPIRTSTPPRKRRFGKRTNPPTPSKLGNSPTIPLPSSKTPPIITVPSKTMAANSVPTGIRNILASPTPEPFQSPLVSPRAMEIDNQALVWHIAFESRLSTFLNKKDNVAVKGEFFKKDANTKSQYAIFVAWDIDPIMCARMYRRLATSTSILGHPSPPPAKSPSPRTPDSPVSIAASLNGVHASMHAPKPIPGRQWSGTPALEYFSPKPRDVTNLKRVDAYGHPATNPYPIDTLNYGDPATNPDHPQNFCESVDNMETHIAQGFEEWADDLPDVEMNEAELNEMARIELEEEMKRMKDEEEKEEKRKEDDRRETKRCFDALFIAKLAESKNNPNWSCDLN